jgi:hypothetical protein
LLSSADGGQKVNGLPVTSSLGHQQHGPLEARKMSTSPIGLGVCNKSLGKAGHWWLTPVILAVQETEIRRIMVQSLGK